MQYYCAVVVFVGSIVILGTAHAASSEAGGGRLLHSKLPASSAQQADTQHYGHDRHFKKTFYWEMLMQNPFGVNTGVTATDGNCNPRKKTQSARFVIRWKDRPADYPQFFTSRGIELTLLYDWDKEASIYEAGDAKEANGIMQGLVSILSGTWPIGASPSLAAPDFQHAIKGLVTSVYGECYYTQDAVQPAVLPTECSGPLPNACPATNPSLWGLNRIHAPIVWGNLPGVVNPNPSASVMVIDSGVNEVHDDLAGNLVNGMTVTGYSYPPRPVSAGNAIPPLTDPNGHGTHVAGTVFARWNNGAGTPVAVVGRALGGSCGCARRNPQNDLERLQLEGICLINCLRYAADSNVRVITLPYGRFQSRRSSINDEERIAVTRLCSKGGIIAISAGNEGVDILQETLFKYPAALAADLAGTHPTCIITVANLQQGGSLSQSSNYGAYVKVAAPGTDIFGTWIGSPTATKTLSGTSMASAHVAGMATLLFNVFTDATQAQVHDCIVTTKDISNPGAPGQFVGGGIVNLEAAFNCVRSAQQQQ